MKTKRYWLLGAAGVVALVAIPVYAHCGKCLDSAREYWNAMSAGKVTLTSAISTAQTAGKGNPIKAVPFKHDDGSVHIHVYLLEDSKLTLAMVDAKTGKLIKTEEAKDLGDDDHEHETTGGDKPKP